MPEKFPLKILPFGCDIPEHRAKAPIAQASFLRRSLQYAGLFVEVDAAMLLERPVRRRYKRTRGVEARSLKCGENLHKDPGQLLQVPTACTPQNVSFPSRASTIIPGVASKGTESDHERLRFIPTITLRQNPHRAHTQIWKSSRMLYSSVLVRFVAPRPGIPSRADLQRASSWRFVFMPIKQYQLLQERSDIPMSCVLHIRTAEG